MSTTLPNRRHEVGTDSMTNDEIIDGDGKDSRASGRSRLTVNEKYKLLKKYAHYLKTQLKSYSGEAVKKGSTIERKLLIYKKLRKLVHYVDENPAEFGEKTEDSKAAGQVEAYYKLLEHKVQKLQNQKQQGQESAGKKEKIGSVVKLADHEMPKATVKGGEENEGEIQIRTNNDISEGEEETDIVTEIGPTPQLNGRVLTIFDIQTSPEQFLVSPLKNRLNYKQENHIGAQNLHIENDDVFKTPSKPASQLEKQPNQLANYLDSSSRKLKFDDVNTTPVKREPGTSFENLNETPRYLRTQSRSLKNIDEIIIGDEWSADELDGDMDGNMGDDNVVLSDDEVDMEIVALPDLDENIDHINVEPSPIIKRMGRSLFDLHKDLIGLRRNLTDLEELVDDDEDIARSKIHNELTAKQTLEPEKETKHGEEIEGKEVPPVNDENSDDNTLVEATTDNTSEVIDQQKEEIQTVFDPHYKLRKKVKTVKRSTKRAKLRTDRLDQKDELAEMDIHALAFGKRPAENPDVGLNCEDENPAADVNGDEDDFAEREEEYVRKDIKQLEKELNVGKAKSKGKHPLSNNFVRLKINRGRFKRRR